MAQIGYCRVFTADQTLNQQIVLLTEYGVDSIIEEKDSDNRVKVFDREGIKQLFSIAQIGDTIVVPSLIRMSRSVKESIILIEKLKELQLELVILSMNLDTRTPIGISFFHITNSFAQFQAELIRESTIQGLSSARKRGRVGGRPKGLTDEAKEKLVLLEAMLKIKALSVEDICRNLKISRGTFYKYKRIIEEKN